MIKLITQPRTPLLLALGALVLLAWAYLFHLADSMDMTAMSMTVPTAWTQTDFILMFLMWAIMMVGMMVPSATPTILIFDTWNKSRQTSGQSYGSTGLFICGYLLAWVLFSLGATCLQWLFNQYGLLGSMMQSNSPALGAFLLIFAGLYQLTPYKEACLKHCQNPLEFIGTHWQPGSLAALKLGAHHGLYCIGCCWLVMGLLFFFGVMNLTWIFLLSLYVLAEKLLPPSLWLSRTTSAVLIGGGVILLT